MKTAPAIRIGARQSRTEKFHSATRDLVALFLGRSHLRFVLPKIKHERSAVFIE